MTTTTAVNPYAALNASTTNAATTKNEAGSQDRFLKLLVAQMQNQDPLNPMDNAQVTTQMAQINTVSGIEKLNTTVEALGGQFAQLQALQGASLVGRDVLLPGDELSVSDAGVRQGAFELDAAADSVKVEVLSSAGRVIDSFQIGAQTTGRHEFDWTPSAGVDASAGARFRITAKSGTTELDTTSLMRDRVEAVSTGGDTLTLELRRKGAVPYTDITAFN